MGKLIKRDKNDSSRDKQHISYILRMRVPQRFLELLITEMLISAIIFALIQMYVITVYSYVPSLWIATFIYWILTYLMAKIDARNANKLKYYYLSKLVAYFLFLIVATIVYLYDFVIKKSSIVSSLYFIFFRLSYIYGISGDMNLTTDEIPISLIFFYGITLFIILLAPITRKLPKKLMSKRSKWEEKAKQRYNKKHNKSSEHSHGDDDNGNDKKHSSHHRHHIHHSHHHEHHHENEDAKNGDSLDSDVDDIADIIDTNNQ